MGIKNNNAAELEALIRGLKISINNHHRKIMVEGDSHILINYITKLLHGTNVKTLSRNWRLEEELRALA